MENEGNDLETLLKILDGSHLALNRVIKPLALMQCRRKRYMLVHLHCIWSGVRCCILPYRGRWIGWQSTVGADCRAATKTSQRQQRPLPQHGPV